MTENYTENHNTFVSIDEYDFCTSGTIKGHSIDKFIRDKSFDEQCVKNAIARDRIKKGTN